MLTKRHQDCVKPPEMLCYISFIRLLVYKLFTVSLYYDSQLLLLLDLHKSQLVLQNCAAFFP